MQPDTIRANLTALADRYGETLADLSRMIGRSDGYLARFIRDGIPAELRTAERNILANYFHVQPDTLEPYSMRETLAELDQMALNPAWPWRWRYRWRAKQGGDGKWDAEVQAGYADEHWSLTGACPRWGGFGLTRDEAVGNAAAEAIRHWRGTLDQRQSTKLRP